jgi:light-regulated signal transduction histidine kinase (bacteriophytochrome)
MTQAGTPEDDCAREPIHLAGAIQPHGYLVSCSWPDWTVRHVSSQVDELFGVPSAELLGTSLREQVQEALLETISDAVRFLDPGIASQRVATANVGALGMLCDISVHLYQGLIHLEIEPQREPGPAEATPLAAQQMIARIAQVEYGQAFLDQVASTVRDLTGYDRVMVYRFRADDAGEVIAEARADDMEPFLGLRYPASDIPPQARALYRLNRLRVIPDVDYVPAPILPPRHNGGAVLDLSYHALRSVSPVHLEYLRNMGVAASMSISIISGGRLWGLVACHHRTPRQVTPATRAVADLLGVYVSMRVATHEQAEALSRFDQSQRFSDVLREALKSGGDLGEALSTYLAVVPRLLRADGALLMFGDLRVPFGQIPAIDRWPVLRAWGAARAGAVASSHRREDWQGASSEAGGPAGLLALAFGHDGDGIYCFRNEQFEDVMWAGEPHKAMVPTDDGQRIAPRRSFAVWRQTVRGTSVEWNEGDIRTAERLYDILREHHRSSEAMPQEHHVMRMRHVARENGERLARLAQLLADMQHLDPAQARLLADRIAELEAVMQGMATP